MLEGYRNEHVFIIQNTVHQAHLKLISHTLTLPLVRCVSNIDRGEVFPTGWGSVFVTINLKTLEHLSLKNIISHYINIFIVMWLQDKLVSTKSKYLCSSDCCCMTAVQDEQDQTGSKEAPLLQHT